MTKEEIIKALVENTAAINNLEEKIDNSVECLEKKMDGQKMLLNDHLHEHRKINWWVFTFLVTTVLTLIGVVYTLIINGLK